MIYYSNVLKGFLMLYTKKELTINLSHGLNKRKYKFTDVKRFWDDYKFGCIRREENKDVIKHLGIFNNQLDVNFYIVNESVHKLFKLRPVRFVEL